MQAAPVQAAPVQAAPVQAAPVQAAPVQAAPVQAAPVQAAPVQAAPVQAAPVQAAPVQAAPVQAAPVQMGYYPREEDRRVAYRYPERPYGFAQMAPTPQIIAAELRPQADAVAELRRYFFLFLLVALPMLTLLAFIAGFWMSRTLPPPVVLPPVPVVNIPVTPDAPRAPAPAAATTPALTPPVVPSSTPIAATAPEPVSKPMARPAPMPASSPEEKPEPPAVEKTATPAEPASPQSAKPLLSGPEDALKAFLAAPDWKARAAHVLNPDKTLPLMEAYHKTWPDVPTRVTSMKVEHSEADPATGRMIFIYQITTDEAPGGFPVALRETPDGWRVDWASFVEFRDNLFQRLAEGPVGQSGVFHLVVRNTHYFGEPFAGSEGFTVYRLDPPMPDREQYGFARSGGEVQRALAENTGWGRPFTPVLEIAKRKAADGREFLEILRVAATDWRPAE